jgi:hypothetical protein
VDRGKFRVNGKISERIPAAGGLLIAVARTIVHPLKQDVDHESAAEQTNRY